MRPGGHYRADCTRTASSQGARDATSADMDHFERNFDLAIAQMRQKKKDEK
jgi:hypothetical protein